MDKATATKRLEEITQQEQVTKKEKDDLFMKEWRNRFGEEVLK